MDENKVLTFGEKAVGLSFNPSNDPAVQKVKELYAEIINLLHSMRVNSNPTDEGREQVRLASIAITEAQGAQMWSVKAVTWKD